MILRQRVWAMFNEIIGETPRQRIKRLNKQIEYWKCFGDTRNCEQPICTFCQHLRVWRDYEGGSDADCIVNANQWLAGDEVHHCRQFKAARQWKYMCEQLLNDAMADIIRDLTGRLTEALKNCPEGSPALPHPVRL